MGRPSADSRRLFLGRVHVRGQRREYALPTGFGSIVAIYPESPVYQVAAAQGTHAVVVGSGSENETLHVAIEPG